MEALASKLSSEHGVKTLVVQADMGTATGPFQLVEQVKAAFGTPEGKLQIDVLINNAGIALNGSLEELPVGTMVDYLEKATTLTCGVLCC